MGNLESSAKETKQIKDTQLLIDTAMLAGEIMLCSGAETYRVEDTMHHILKTADDAEMIEVLVLMTGINATLKRKGELPVSIAKRVTSRGTNLSNVVEVNEISRRYCGQYLTLEQAHKALQKVKDDRKTVQHPVALAGACAGFTLMFGGRFTDAGIAMIVGVFMSLCQYIGYKLDFHAFIQDVFSAGSVAFSSIVLKAIIGAPMDMDIIMISAIMPLVPGMAITNAIRDTMQGDYISGTTRTVEAFLKAAGIALGMGLGIAVFSGIFLKGVI